MSDLVIIFILGACIGSFLNVCIYRIPQNIPVALSRSKCGTCKKMLRFIDMIPVLTFLMYKGRCAYCKSKFSSRYMMIELLTAFMFMFAFVHASSISDFLIGSFLLSIFIVIVFIDIDYMIIPNRLVLLVIMVGIVNIWLGNISFIDSLYGILTALGIIISIYVLGGIVYKRLDVLGMGDVKLSIALGMVLGVKGLIVMMYVAIVSCGLLGIYLIVKKQAKEKKVPFGPFIILGAFIAYYYGDQILKTWLEGGMF
ncbi:prepilin peptidase [Fusibacter sp. JL216-2]|uniref:prepilin peptidase n=1 Tax=Fusibacter sp. JL216-2 TaxID=3071453 RepID=UPI003D34E830